MKKITVSLIVSTYNWPQALELTLRSALRQSVLPDEIIVADDGSGPETSALVERYAAQSPVRVVHIWQEDDGFRLAAIRNKAIAASRCDYIVQVDGDVLLHRHFIRDHIRLAAPGHLVSGSRVLIGPETSARLLETGAPRLTLCSRGLRNRINGVRFPLLTGWMTGFDPSQFRGCNMAYWRQDMLRTNGYDELMRGWGHEDVEMALRMKNLGIGKRTMKFSGIVYHLHHREASRTNAQQNLDLLQASAAQQRTRCEKGINQYLSQE